MGATEIVQALVSPADKLIDAISGAIGKVYEPHSIRKMAEAKACEINVIADTVRNNSDIPIVYNSNGVAIDTSNYEEIVKRASSRLAFQEITKQQNIESIADKAYDELKNSDAVSNEPVSKDWTFRFFNAVEDISDEEMQKIWAHILAGEIKKPNTYSYRTIEKLKNLTRQEAELFQRIANFSLQSTGAVFIPQNNNILNKYDIYFKQLLDIEEYGLMSTQNISFTLELTESKPCCIITDKYIGIIRVKDSTRRERLTLSVYSFTESGKQLIKIIQPQVGKQYFFDCLDLIRSENDNISVTAHTINSFCDDESIDYDSTNILP